MNALIKVFFHLKNTNITTVFKKGFRGSKDNYRSVSILPIISKILRNYYQNKSLYTWTNFSLYIDVGLENDIMRSIFFSQWLRNGKEAVDNGNAFGALLKDLLKSPFKVFDCLPHDLIIVKLNSYGFSLTALNLIHNYLTKRKQRTKINQPYSSWKDILFGVPQGSMLGSVLFNIFLSDFFLIVDNVDIANYVDDNTIYKEH